MHFFHPGDLILWQKRGMHLVYAGLFSYFACENFVVSGQECDAFYAFFT
jgi:hypothetical protein